MSELKTQPIDHIKNRENYQNLKSGDYFYEESGEEGLYYIYYLKHQEGVKNLVRQIIHDREHNRRLATCIHGTWHWVDSLEKEEKKIQKKEEDKRNKVIQDKMITVEKSIYQMFANLDKCGVHKCIVHTDLGEEGRTLTSIKHRPDKEPDFATVMNILCSNYAPNIDLFMINLMKYCESNNIDTSKSMVFKMLKDMPKL